jgi:hypothetical protein
MQLVKLKHNLDEGHIDERQYTAVKRSLSSEAEQKGLGELARFDPNMIVNDLDGTIWSAPEFRNGGRPEPDAAG